LLVQQPNVLDGRVRERQQRPRRRVVELISVRCTLALRHQVTIAVKVISRIASAAPPSLIVSRIVAVAPPGPVCSTPQLRVEVNAKSASVALELAESAPESTSARIVYAPGAIDFGTIQSPTSTTPFTFVIAITSPSDS